MCRKYYVYILTNKTNRVLYIGVTNDLPRRIWEHKQKLIKGFTQKYNCTKLIYFEETESVYSAIEREKQLKNWHREWKENLISEMNPNWEDLGVKYHLFGEGDKDTGKRDAETILKQVQHEVQHDKDEETLNRVQGDR